MKSIPKCESNGDFQALLAHGHVLSFLPRNVAHFANAIR